MSGESPARHGKPRGFAAMDARRQREIASKGGRAAHAQGVAHEFSPEEAKRAGTLGGRKVAADRAHMAEIGKKGSAASHARAGHAVRQETDAAD